jgi:hypothetical protein
MPPNNDIDTARDDLRRSIMAAFCNVLHATQLPPMTVMALAAAAVGSIYKEIADEHRRDNTCPCGWQPAPGADLEALQAALAATTKILPHSDLRIVQAAGRA